MSYVSYGCDSHLFVFDASILWFAAGYIVLDILSSSLTGAVMASVLDRSTGAILAVVLDHSVGAVLGFCLAVALVKLKWVDCENWDLFAILAGRPGQSKAAARRARSRAEWVAAESRRAPRSKRKRPAKESKVRVTSMEDAAGSALRTLRRHLELGEFEAALAVYKKSTRSLLGWKPAEPDWIDLIQAVVDQNAWDEAVAVMRDYVQRTPHPSPRVRLKLAQVLIQKLSRPLQGLAVLNQIPAGALSESLEATQRKLVREAEQLREEGDLELQDELW